MLRRTRTPPAASKKIDSLRLVTEPLGFPTQRSLIQNHSAITWAPHQSEDVLVDAVATRGLSSPCRYWPAQSMEVRHEVSPVPAGEPASGEVLPGMRDSAVCSVRQLEC